MPRSAAYRLGVVGVFALGAAALLYWRNYDEPHPAPDEFRIYRVFLKRLATDSNWQGQIALAETTLRSSEPQYQNWVPAELRTDKMTPPPDVVNFCGEWCGRDFVKKNLVVWHFNSNAQEDVGFPIDQNSQDRQIPPQHRVVAVTRVGFNLWHTRAVLWYSADCNDYSPEHPVMCSESGTVYLKKINGSWQLDHYYAIDL